MKQTAFKMISYKTLICSLAFALTTGPLISAGQVLAEPAAHAAEQSALAVQTQAPIKYRIDARLDEQNMHIRGQESVTYRNTSADTLHEIVFHTFADANRSKATQTTMFQRNNKEIQQENPQRKPDEFLGGIDILSATADGQPLVFTNNNQSLTVQLKQGLKPGESMTIEIEFDVILPYGMQRLSYYKDIINGAHAFPAVSVYDEIKHEWDKSPYSQTFETDYYTSSDFEVHFNVPESYRVLMPGTLTSQEDPKETGRKIVSAVTDNTREFVFFASPNYKVESVTRDGLTIEYYYLDNMPDKKKIVDQYIDTAFEAITFFNEKYGKYPYPEFRIAESYVEGVAVEFSRVIQMGQIQLHADPKQDYVFVHEIAHQWFHSLIGNNSETESFLDEGFADFSKVYFAEKQGDDLNGFKSIQMEDWSFVDKPIISTNREVGDDADPVYYKKGRQAIYQLYRSVGEEKFDAFMKEYFRRYEFENATIEGLLQTIQDKLGNEVKVEMDKALRDPQFTLKPEYQLSEAEKSAFWHEQFKSIYRSSMTQLPDLPLETMSRIIDKALKGEPLTIVLDDQASDKAFKQQQTILEQLQGTLGIMGIQAEIITKRQALKDKLEKELATSNLIVIGGTQSSGIIQAFKPGIIQKSNAIGFDWQGMMRQKDASGGYIIKHPYNQNRLLLHFFWNGDTLDSSLMDRYAAQMLNVLGFSGDYYQSYVWDKAGNITSDKKTVNPMSKFFAGE